MRTRSTLLALAATAAGIAAQGQIGEKPDTEVALAVRYMSPET